jgi:RNA polymerase sigma factor (sigma-70 family)
MEHIDDLIIPHLFRAEYSKIVSVLSARFGLASLDLAEDVASETFLAAMQTWPYKGVPSNPEAWLHTVAKNRLKNALARQRNFDLNISAQWKQLHSDESVSEIDLEEQNVLDSQLRMLFAICHPSLPPESQIALALRVLCGFGIDEIANAFLTNRETISKRLYRAKQKIREENIELVFPAGQGLAERLNSVIATIYLLFSEGYYSEVNENVIREELCVEAMRLCYFLCTNVHTQTPEVNSLMALMCFHVSRFPARKDRAGQLILYAGQDRSLWDQSLIKRGIEYLSKAAVGKVLSRYHIEAMLAYWQTVDDDSKEKWEKVLELYNRLLMIQYSPAAALNRTFALWKAKGATSAIEEAGKLKLNDNPYYFSLLASLYYDVDRTRARTYLENAIALAKTDLDKNALRKRLREFD